MTGKPKASLSCFATVDLPAPLCPLIKITLDGSASAHLTKYKSSLDNFSVSVLGVMGVATGVFKSGFNPGSDCLI